MLEAIGTDAMVEAYHYWKLDQKRGNKPAAQYSTPTKEEPTKEDLSSVLAFRNFLHNKRGFGEALRLQSEWQGR